MVKFYNNRELSDKLGVNLARWKRWSREFLPPDPLAGQQAGYARQYYVEHAFVVYLGGHLVAELGFSIPQARWILSESKDWMRTSGFHFDPRGYRKPRKGIDAHIRRYALHILVASDQQLILFARGHIGSLEYEYEGYPPVKSVYVDQPISPLNQKQSDTIETGSEKILRISDLLEQFRKTLDPDGDYFPGLVVDQGDRMKTEG